MFRLTGLYSIARRAVCIGTEDMAKGKFFYAVAKGTKPGVYKTWDECRSQVEKFPNASFKKFPSEKEAWAFFRGEKVAPKVPKVPDVTDGRSLVQREEFAGKRTKGLNEVLNLLGGVSQGTLSLPKRGPEALEYIPLGKKRPCVDEEEETPTKRVKLSDEGSQGSASSSGTKDGFTYMGDAVVVYTDGCCSGNGRVGAKAGIGVYWGRDHPLNVAEPLDGRQTNQRAELQAACKALEQAKEMNIKKLVLYTDSKFTINGVTSWVKNWKLNGWRLNSGGHVINKDDFQQLDKLNGEVEVVWLHVPGHAGFLGNEEADRLSRVGAAKQLQPKEKNGT